MLERLWVSGYRAWEIGTYGDQDPKIKVVKFHLRTRLMPLVQDGLQWLITGGEMGVEAWSLEVVTELKEKGFPLKMALMTPYTDFGHRWNEENQSRLRARQQSVDFAASTSSRPYENPAQLQAYTNFMLTHTDAALFVYDPEHEGKSKFAYRAALRHADKRDYPIMLSTMDDLEEAARELAEQEELRGFD